MPPAETPATATLPAKEHSNVGEILTGSMDFAAAADTEIANTVTHALGLLLAIAGGAFLLSNGTIRADHAKYLACSIYSVSLVSLYAASCLYHGVRDPGLKAAMRVFDQVCIYLLIGGTATPFFLLLLPTPLSFYMVGGIWSLGIFGIALRLAYPTRYDGFSLILYLGMSWLGTTTLDSFIPTAPAILQNLIVAGGIVYTVGILFYLSEKVFRWGHVIWHLFVLTGSAMHFAAITLAVL
ncbi:MAG: hemolysin III family protein [bacterium]